MVVISFFSRFLQLDAGVTRGHWHLQRALLSPFPLPAV